LLAGGAGLIVLYTGLIALADAITKDLGMRYVAPQMYAVSGLVVVGLCVVTARLKSDRERLTTTCPWAMALRAAATVLATVCFFLAFRHLPFAQVFLFIALMPLFSGLMAGPVLGERVSPSAWMALAAGFVGVLCLFPQGISAIGFGHVVALLAAAFGTLSIVLSRFIGRYDRNAIAQVFYPNLSLLVVMSLAVPFVWQPMPLVDMLWAALYGFVLFSARWLLVIALRDLSAHAATSLMKLQFVWMVLIGAVVFGEWPAANTYLGVMIVIGSGLFLVFDDQYRRTPARA
jgi:drug/metabolite transporter (DMT)-like permease